FRDPRSGRRIASHLAVGDLSATGHQAALPRVGSWTILADLDDDRHDSRHGHHLLETVPYGTQRLPADADGRPHFLDVHRRAGHRRLWYLYRGAGYHPAGEVAVFASRLSPRIPESADARA